MDLDRFVSAQDGGVYERALAEVRQGGKRSHWMWFVFPQLAGLGSSPTAAYYAIRDLAEARAYLAHPRLGPRLIEISAAVAASPVASATVLLGHPDDLKLRSSMTLFGRAAPDQEVFTRVLARYFDGVPDARTDELLTGR
ncbi:hypothetical protein Ade02nite_78970 [Paractinoplanes deccanensis]|uniref:Calpastatin n=1 Tax=Paractinoplanes deccanensis TaxID=113561 RepID=A0ABQ3YGY3_9ACTN|nr:DUF1810 domain-containing protein [Actinoplanes deccanensis]GID79256.1 hypothetical protein Ade02nite_78970 [Actinoplanes deccanensis]